MPYVFQKIEILDIAWPHDFYAQLMGTDYCKACRVCSKLKTYYPKGLIKSAPQARKNPVLDVSEEFFSVFSSFPTIPDRRSVCFYTIFFLKSIGA